MKGEAHGLPNMAPTATVAVKMLKGEITKLGWNIRFRDTVQVERCSRSLVLGLANTCSFVYQNFRLEFMPFNMMEYDIMTKLVCGWLIVRICVFLKRTVVGVSLGQQQSSVRTTAIWPINQPQTLTRLGSTLQLYNSFIYFAFHCFLHIFVQFSYIYLICIMTNLLTLILAIICLCSKIY